MAIKKTVVCSSQVQGEYIKVMEMRYCGASKCISFTIAIYKNAAAKLNFPESPIERRSYGPISCTVGSVVEAYEYLKTLDDYSSAEDI